MSTVAWVRGMLLGPYALEGPLGTGGMGEVWKARDTRVGRLVAIKRLKAEHAERITREARALAAVNHPHICQLYDVGPDYLVMEYVEGEPLTGPMPVSGALRLALQMADALATAHRKGLVHRDLKPRNILVNESGVKLLDFGLATLDTGGDGTTVAVAASDLDIVLGTLAYMSPEQAQGHTVDARSDVFSFGAVLYELLSGGRAFERDTLPATIAAVVSQQPPPLESAGALGSIVRRCLAKHPRDRFQAMTEVRIALEQAMDAPADGRPSIAVLPFVNMSRDPDDEYFSDGLAEDIINALAQIPGLKVIARTSAFAFKGQNTDIRRIADALDVTNVLEGSVRKAGTRIRVTAQLVSAADGGHLWSQRYDRDIEDVFAVQDEIATAIANTLQVKLAVPPRVHTPNVAAYEAFLRGRHQWAKLTPESLAQSRDYYEQAVALDPQFASARCALAEHFFALAVNGILPAHETMPQARAGALGSLELDRSLPDAHALLGLIAGFHDHDWKEAEERFRAARSRQPVAPRVRWTYGLYLAAVGRNREAIEQLDLALRDDPLHLLGRSHYAAVLYAFGRRADGVAQATRVLEIDSNFGIAYWYLGIFHALNGIDAEARKAAERSHSLRPWDTMTKGLLAGVLVNESDAVRAESLCAELTAASFGGAFGWAVCHLVRGGQEQCAAAIGNAVRERDSRVPFLLPFVRTGPQWPEIAAMMNLPGS